MSSTFDLLFRTDDPARWGDGTGRNLHPSEVDLNFWILLELFLSLEENPTLPKDISSITVANNQMTIHLNDGTTTFGPFDLPVATFRWRGNWQGTEDYLKFDLFNQANGLYMVLIDHTSDATFDPDASNLAGPLYRLLIAYPVTFDIGFFFPGLPGTGIDAANPIFSYQPAHDFFLPAGLADSVASVDVAFTNATSFEIRKNGTAIGSVNFAALASDATFTFAADVQFVGRTDKLKVMVPTAVDSDGKNLTVTFAGTKGLIESGSSS